MKKLMICLFIVPSVALSQRTVTKATDNFTYKKTAERNLKIYSFKPPTWEKAKQYPSIVFYFGGALIKRNLNQLENIAQEFSENGYVAFLADYRVKSRENVTALDCISDARDAFAFVRENADRFSLDDSKITAFGYSSGGYLASALGTLDDPIHGANSKPNSMILLAMGNPTKYRTPRWLGTSDLSPISPVDNINKETPAALIFIGDKDYLLQIAKNFHKKMLENNRPAEFVLFEGKGHSFWMQNKKDAYFKEIFTKSIDFLNTLNK